MLNIVVFIYRGVQLNLMILVIFMIYAYVVV